MPKKSAKKTVKKTAKTIKAVKTTTKPSRKGGARPGAGRPAGTGKYGAPTKAVRVPIHLIDKIMAFVDKEVAAEKKKAKK